MKNVVTFSNPYTGEVKQVKVGFSWILLIFSGFWGIPLFLRGLYRWAILMVMVSLLGFATEGQIFQGVGLPLAFAVIVLQIYLGFEGNEITAKNYLNLGWKMSGEPDAVKAAKLRWGII